MQTVKDAKIIINELVKVLNPEKRVREILRKQKEKFQEKKLHVLSIGKAAWDMAAAAHTELGNRIEKGIVITKYDHSRGRIGDFEIFEAGHPVPDEMSVQAAKRAVEVFGTLGEKDLLIFLISGGGSSLFEIPVEGLDVSDTAEITQIMLKAGWDIKLINSIRKRLSIVKAGQFAQTVSPAEVKAYIISDVLGDNVEDIASGPVSPVSEDYETFKRQVESLDLACFDLLKKKEAFHHSLERCLPEKTDNAETHIIDNVSHACKVAAAKAKAMGYHSRIITSHLECEASEKEVYSEDSEYTLPCCLVFGGETTVHIRGTGLGGRNQEIALASAIELKDMKADITLFSFGTDGTDGPTDAAGGIVTSDTYDEMVEKGIKPEELLRNNDSYHALKKTDRLIMTGPTGTNVNDVICVLMK
jgi:hydroxypyruvate reductase